MLVTKGGALRKESGSGEMGNFIRGWRNLVVEDGSCVDGYESGESWYKSVFANLDDCRVVETKIQWEASSIIYIRPGG